MPPGCRQAVSCHALCAACWIFFFSSVVRDVPHSQHPYCTTDSSVSAVALRWLGFLYHAGNNKMKIVMKMMVTFFLLLGCVLSVVKAQDSAGPVRSPVSSSSSYFEDAPWQASAYCIKYVWQIPLYMKLRQKFPTWRVPGWCDSSIESLSVIGDANSLLPGHDGRFSFVVWHSCIFIAILLFRDRYKKYRLLASHDSRIGSRTRGFYSLVVSSLEKVFLF